MVEPIAIKRIKLVVTIAERGNGDKIRAACDKVHKAFHLSFMGRGTAPTRVLEYLGLASSEKNVIFSVVPEELVHDVLRSLRHELELDKSGGGIAFSVPITSVGGPATLRMISCMEEEKLI